MFTYLDPGKNESAYFKRILFELILYMVSSVIDYNVKKYMTGLLHRPAI